jgi:hypothetical protein
MRSRKLLGAVFRVELTFTASVIGDRIAVERRRNGIEARR